jgi:hypothetical protein
MADKIIPLPAAANSLDGAFTAQKSVNTKRRESIKRLSKAAITMKSFTRSNESMEAKFVQITETAEYKQSQADMVAKYDTNGDGNFDRQEVLAICHDVAFKSFVETENVAGAQRMAEALNTTKVRPPYLGHGGSGGVRGGVGGGVGGAYWGVLGVLNRAWARPPHRVHRG